MSIFDYKPGEWIPWWEWCPQKNYVSHPPDFSGLDPDTGEPWSPRKIIEIKGMSVQDSSEVRAICEKVLADNPKEVEVYKSGKTKVIGKLIKATLDASGGSADPREVKDILTEVLSK